MERVIRLHSGLQTTLSGLLLILALWGLIAAWRGGFARSYPALLSIAQWLLVAEAILGLIWFVALGMRGLPALHLIYGVIGLGLLPATRIWLRERNDRRAALSYAAICFFLLIVVIRSYETAG